MPNRKTQNAKRKTQNEKYKFSILGCALGGLFSKHKRLRQHFKLLLKVLAMHLIQILTL
ncbi:MAG: hypothetical protein ACJAYE_002154 [Candidatus Azotimanducaceae bacterium]|jgi:hypothetical protein